MELSVTNDRLAPPTQPFVLNLQAINAEHVQSVGGKNASTGEMLQHLTNAGIKVPGGFATTVKTYPHFL